MKAPKQYHPAIALEAQSINYSMLPPEKLPNWLVKKDAPPKIHNYSMRPPDARQQFAPIQKIAPTPPEILTQPPALLPVPAEPIVLEKPLLVTPEIIPVPEEPEIEEVPELSPEISVSGTDFPKNDTPDPLEARIAQTNLIPITETPASIEKPSSTQTHILTPSPPIWEAQSSPPAAGPQGYPYNRVLQPSKSFGDWILNNSNISMIIVVGIIVFAIVLIVLLSLGVI